MKKNLYDDIILSIQKRTENSLIDLTNLDIAKRQLEIRKKYINETNVAGENKEEILQDILNEEKFLDKKIGEILSATYPEQEYLDKVNGQIFISNQNLCSVLRGKTGLPWKYQVTVRDAHKLVFYENSTGRFFNVKPSQNTNSPLAEKALEHLNWFDAFLNQKQSNDGKTEYTISPLNATFSLPDYYDRLLKSYFRSLEVDLQHPEKLISYFATPKKVETTQNKGGKHK